MEVTTKNFTTLVNEQKTAIQGKARLLIDTSIGSIILSIIESNAGVILWLQSLVLDILRRSRASTSTGEDLDSWMIDWGITRNGSIPSEGTLDFSRTVFTATSPEIFIPANDVVETIVQTGLDQIQFKVKSAPGHADYDEVRGGYILPEGAGSVNVPSVAVLPGVAGNVAANTINEITGAVPGIELVNNPGPFTGGAEEESDTDFRERFVLYLASLRRATKEALRYSVLELRQGLDVQVVGNEEYVSAATEVGNPINARPGSFYAVVDDGSGAPDQDLLDAASVALEANRAFTVVHQVFAPAIEATNVVMEVTVSKGTNQTLMEDQVRSSIDAHMQGLKLGDSLSYTRLGEIPYDFEEVVNVSGIQIDGDTFPNDKTVTVKQIIRPGTLVVNVNEVA